MTNADGLRPIVEALDREMSRLVACGDARADTSALLAAWAKLDDPTSDRRDDVGSS